MPTLSLPRLYAFLLEVILVIGIFACLVASVKIPGQLISLALVGGGVVFGVTIPQGTTPARQAPDERKDP